MPLNDNYNYARVTIRNMHQSSVEIVEIGRLFCKEEVADDQYRCSGEDCHDRTQQRPDPRTGSRQSQFAQPPDGRQIRTAWPTAGRAETAPDVSDPRESVWRRLARIGKDVGAGTRAGRQDVVRVVVRTPAREISGRPT